jgi:hypothetical protein
VERSVQRVGTQRSTSIVYRLIEKLHREHQSYWLASIIALVL